MRTNSRAGGMLRGPVLAVCALVLLALLAGPATATAGKAQRAMPQETQTRLAVAHRAARAGCHRVARRHPAIRRMCGRIKPPRAGVRRAASVAAGYRQFGFVCRFETNRWRAVPFSSPDDFAADSRDFLLWMQFPPNFDQLPGGVYVMTVFASVYCDVYGTVAFPTPSTTTPPDVQPDAPVMLDACGVTNDRYRIPDAVPVPLFTLFGPDETTVNLADPDVGAMYLVDGVVTPPGTYVVPTAGTRTVTIEAVPTTSRYTVLRPRRWVLEFDATPCPQPVTPVKPVVADELCGPDNDVIGRVADIKGLAYDYGRWRDNSRTVTATVQPGYVIPGDVDGVVSWTFTDDAEACPTTVTTRSPTVREVCGPRNDVITVPVIVGVTYTVGDWASDGSLQVTAAANPGYVIAAGSAVAWRVVDGARECPWVEPPTPPTKLSIRMIGKSVRATDKPVKYGIIVRNTGSTTARNVVIRDAIPAGLAVVRRPVDSAIRSGVIVWRIGDLQPGSWIYLDATMKAARNRTVRRCNTARAVALNASAVRATRCTRFVRVAASRFAGVTG